MTYESFLTLVKTAGVDTLPYIPFSLENEFVYENGRDNRKKNRTKDEIHFIIQYWETGGASGGACWEGCVAEQYSTGDTAPRSFPELTKILTAVCPGITLLQYEEVKSIMREGNETEYEYYGNYTDYAYNLIKMKELYDKLTEMGLLK